MKIKEELLKRMSELSGQTITEINLVSWAMIEPLIDEFENKLSKRQENILDILKEVIWQSCERNGEVDSLAITSYAIAIRLLANEGRPKVKAEYGRRIIAEELQKES